MLKKPQLYVIATPIGNLEDITLRAITVLKSVNLIAAEDTRHSRKILTHYSINTPLYSLHAHNERTHSNRIIEHLNNQEDVAYITDAGTPLISDPGAYLVKSVRAAGFNVVPIPGPCAAIAALSVSGFVEPQFYFEGFLPHKSSTRKQRLVELQTVSSTLIFYESPHRIVAMLSDMLTVLGNREVVIARELTKRFETILTGRLTELLQTLKTEDVQRLGEFVVLVAGKTEILQESFEKVSVVLALLLEELPLKKAVVLASKLLEIGKNELYEMALKLKNPPAR